MEDKIKGLLDRIEGAIGRALNKHTVDPEPRKPEMEQPTKLCRGCKTAIHKGASICPHCRTVQLGKPLGCAGALGLILIAVIIIVASQGGSKSGSSGTEDRAKDEKVAQLDSEIHEMVVKGAIHSIDVEGHQVRMEVGLWLKLDVKHKQGFVQYFSQYFKLKTDNEGVEILSDQNDTVLGEYSIWSGVKINL